MDELEDKDALAYRNAKGLLSATIYDERIWKRLTALSVQDLSQQFGRIAKPYEGDWEGWDEVEIYFGPDDGERERTIKFQLQPDTDVWARPYSLIEYAEAFGDTVKTLDLPGIDYYEADTLIGNGFGIYCEMSADNPLMSDELERCAGILRRVQEKAEELLLASVRENAVTTFFRFPVEVRAACEQYLLYFVQFLEDLGVKAQAELKEDARSVLFSVTPRDGQAALQQVREALQIYLQLPSAPAFAAQAGLYPDLAVRQLHANVLHLQSQLMLANASIQAQGATIEALQFSNYQYRQLISSGQQPKDQTEPLIGDTVHVTRIEGKGLSIDLPKILKRLKRVFGIGKKD